jgi:acetyl esterase/lipase
MPDPSVVKIETTEIQGKNGRSIAVLVATPAKATGPLPGFLQVHGGGLLFGWVQVVVIFSHGIFIVCEFTDMTMF